MRKTRHTILFQEGSAETVVLAAAKYGASNKAIERILRSRKFHGLSTSQITSRLSKAKLWEGKSSGYRVAYRNGESDEFKKLLSDRMAIAEAEISRKLPRMIAHPTPRILAYVEEHRGSHHRKAA